MKFPGYQFFFIAFFGYSNTPKKLNLVFIVVVVNRCTVFTDVRTCGEGYWLCAFKQRTLTQYHCKH